MPQERNKQSTTYVLEDSEYTCLITKMAQSDIPVNSTSWLVDSTCTAHMTFDRSNFANYKPMQSAAVEMETKAKVVVAGCGDVILDLNVNGCKVFCKLKDVLHVPDFGYSLLSVSKMTANGLSISFKHNRCIISQGSTAVATASLVDKLYVLDVNDNFEIANVASMKTWHERLAHVHMQGIVSMIRNNVISGIRVSQSDLRLAENPISDCDSVTCTACVYGKETRAMIPRTRSSDRANSLLDLVHSDICGPMQVRSIGGARYFITFIDDH